VCAAPGCSVYRLIDAAAAVNHMLVDHFNQAHPGRN